MSLIKEAKALIKKLKKRRSYTYHDLEIAGILEGLVEEIEELKRYIETLYAYGVRRQP